MKFNISEKDMEIILDALEALHQDMRHSDENGHPDINVRRGYTIDEVDLLFQSFDNAGNYHAVMKDKL